MVEENFHERLRASSEEKKIPQYLQPFKATHLSDQWRTCGWF